jgi:hypothetical protein
VNDVARVGQWICILDLNFTSIYLLLIWQAYKQILKDLFWGHVLRPPTKNFALPLARQPSQVTA